MEQSEDDLTNKFPDVEQTPPVSDTPTNKRNLTFNISLIFKKINTKRTAFLMGGITLLAAIGLGVSSWFQEPPSKLTEQPIPTPVTKQPPPSELQTNTLPTINLQVETLQLQNASVSKSNREIVFLKDDKLWLLDKDLEKIEEYKLTESTEPIVDFSFSSDGHQLYWLTDSGEIWKRNENKEIKQLITKESDMSEQTFKDPVTGEESSYFKDKVMAFYLSPNNNYIAYETLDTFTGCCMSPHNMPVNQMRMMKSDGTGKVAVQKPFEITRSLLFFNGWLSGGNHILFHFSYPDEATQGSAFYSVGVDGKNPEIFSPINTNKEQSMTIAGAVPIFSPDGEKMAYLEGGIFAEGRLWLSDINGENKKTLGTIEENYFPDFSWSKDGTILVVNTADKFIIYDRQANEIYQTSSGQETNFENQSIVSPSNKYVVVSNRDRIFLINTDTKMAKELIVTNAEDMVRVLPQFFAGNDRFYYLIDHMETGFEGSYPELWVIDLNSYTNYKVAENVSLVGPYLQINTQ